MQDPIIAPTDVDILSLPGANTEGAGLIKPEDIIKASQALEANGGVIPPPTATPPEPPPAPETPAVPAAPVNMDELIAKMEGKTITPEEQAILDKALDEQTKALEATPPPAPVVPAPAALPEKKYNIAGTEYTAEQMVEKMKADKFIPGDLKVASEYMEKWIDAYYKQQNGNEFLRSTTQKAEENAHTRKANQELSSKLVVENMRLQERQRALAQQEQQIAARKTRLMKDAQSSVTAADIIDPSTNQIDVDKQFEYNNKRAAQSALQDLAAEELQLQESQTETRKQALEVQILTFVEQHPQYQPKNGDLFEVWSKVNRGEQVDPEDELRILELSDIMSAAADRQLAPGKIFTLRKGQRTLAVQEVQAQPSPQSNSAPPATPPVLPDPQQTLAEKVRKFRELKARVPATIPGGGGPASTPGNKRASEGMIEHAHQILKQPNQEEVWRSLQ